MKPLVLRVALAATIIAATSDAQLSAHIGSPDVFLDGQAGPYRVFVTIRPPRAIPGVAEVEILTPGDEVTNVHIVPLPLTGPGAQFAPVPDQAVRARDDPRLFTGTLWMMTAGAWQVRITVSGGRGEGQLSVPVPTLPKETLEMSTSLGVVLAVLALILYGGFVSIVATIARDAGLPPGAVADPARRRRGRIAGAIAAVVVGVGVFFGNMWWGVEATNYARYVYKPLQMTTAAHEGAQLQLSLSDPGWLRNRRLDDFALDHGHPMHLFVLTRDLNRLWHLHPDVAGDGVFEQRLPDMPAGRYELFADVVHRTGVAETVTTSFDTQGVKGTALADDDSYWSSTDQPAGRIVWVDRQPLVPRRLTLFTFRVEDDNGQPARDLELYMGMPGHAVFVRRDLGVFAHVHPSGSAPMASLRLANARSGQTPDPSSAGEVDHVHGGTLPPTVTFPYGFPEAGEYRIFVQVKRAGQVHTAAFDAHVE